MTDHDRDPAPGDLGNEEEDRDEPQPRIPEPDEQDDVNGNVAEPPEPDDEEDDERPVDDEKTRAATAAAEEACSRILGLGGFDVRVLAVPGDPVRVEVQGEDAGRVIGRRGMTLQALQYLVSRIVGQKVSRYVPVKVDVEGYRVRRESALRSMAERVATDVARSGRSVLLEPMTPLERRIVHLALAEDPDVETISEGEGEGRYVVVRPKTSSRPAGNR